MVLVDAKDMFQLLISEFRYAVQRDNHLAPSTCADLIKTYLPELPKEWRGHTACQLSNEIIEERLWQSRHLDPDFKFKKDYYVPLGATTKNQLVEDYIWEDLLVFLSNYLESIPVYADRYMKYIYGKMDYSQGIDYFSDELHEKIQKNRKTRK